MAEELEQGPAKGQFRLTLKVKLSFLIIALVVLSIGLVSASSLYQTHQALTEQITKRGVTIAENLAASVKNPLVTDDELTLNVLLKNAMRDKDVRYVIIADHRGRAMAHSDVSLVGKPVERPRGLRPLGDDQIVQPYSARGQGSLIDIAIPLFFRDVRIGAVYLGFSQAAIQEALAAERTDTIKVSAFMVLVGIGGAVILATLLSRPIQRLMVGTREIAAGNFAVSLPVSSRDELGALTDAFNSMAASLREKESIKRAFARYVAREVADEILKDPETVAVTGERREVTVLFCDIRGFTPTAERLSPEEVVTLLNSFYRLLVDTTSRYEGTVDKFLGDGAMCVFGAPVYYEDHTLRAIKTALEVQARVKALAARRRAAGREAFSVGIGVNTGDAVAGSVGTEHRMEYTVIGDNVNLAARLQAHAKRGQILVSEWTYEKVKEHVLGRSLGRIKVKGKEEHVQVYEVLGLARVEATA